MMTGLFAQYFASSDYLAGLPLILLALFAGGILVMDTMMPRAWRALNGWTALLGLAFCGAALTRAYYAGVAGDHGFVVINALFGTFVFDRVTLVAESGLLIMGAAVFLLAVRRSRREGELSGAFCALVLLALMGLFCVAAAHDMVLMLVALQLVVVCLSLLLALPEAGGEAGPQWDSAWKLLMAGTLATAALAFTLSLLYGLSGQTALIPAATKLEALMHAGAVPQPFLGLVGFSAILAFGTLVTLVPFHSWAPFSLEFAPPPVALLLAAGMPLAAWPLAIRLFGETLYPMRTTLAPLFIFVGLLSLALGSFAMLLQGNLHRFLAYAAVSQAGFMILGLVSSFSAEKAAPEGLQGVFIHLPALVLALVGCYAAGAVAAPRPEFSARIEDFAGLFHRSWSSAAALTVLLLSLAGLPLGGFWGRYTLMKGLWQTQHPWLVAAAVGFSLIALFGYLRLIRRMADRGAAADAYGVVRPVTRDWSPRAILILSAIAVAAMSYPLPVQAFVKWMLYL